MFEGSVVFSSLNIDSNFRSGIKTICFFLGSRGKNSFTSAIGVTFYFPNSRVHVVGVIRRVDHANRINTILRNNVNATITTYITIYSILRTIIIRRNMVPGLIRPHRLRRNATRPITNPNRGMKFRLLTYPRLIRMFHRFKIGTILMLLGTNILYHDVCHQIVIRRHLFDSPVPQFPHRLLPTLIFLRHLLMFILDNVPLRITPRTKVSHIRLKGPYTRDTTRYAKHTTKGTHFRYYGRHVLIRRHLNHFLITRRDIGNFINMNLRGNLRDVIHTTKGNINGNQMNFPRHLVTRLSTRPIHGNANRHILNMVQTRNLNGINRARTISNPSYTGLYHYFRGDFFQTLPHFIANDRTITYTINARRQRGRHQISNARSRILDHTKDDLIRRPPRVTLTYRDIHDRIFSNLINVPTPLVRPFRTITIIVHLIMRLAAPSSFINYPSRLQIVSYHFRLLINMAPTLGAPSRLLFNANHRNQKRYTHMLPSRTFSVFLFSLRVTFRAPSNPFTGTRIVMHLRMGPNPISFILNMTRLFRVTIRMPNIFRRQRCARTTHIHYRMIRTHQGIYYTCDPT